MIKEFFGNIKSDKKLHFSHWRFKILHWAFGIDPKSPNESKLPKYLYTKYCPLFHLTNLIVLFSIPILLFKIAISLFTKVLIPTIFYFISMINKIIGYMVCLFSGDKDISEFKERSRKSSIIKTLFKLKLNGSTRESFMNDYVNFCLDDDNDTYRFLNHDILPYIFSKDDLETRENDLERNKENILIFNSLYEMYHAYYEDNKSSLIRSQKKQEKRNNKLKERTVFLINCSSMLFKGIINTLYVLFFAILSFATIYLSIFAVKAMFSLLSSVSASSILSLIKDGVNILINILLFSVPMFLIIYFSKEKLKSFLSVIIEVLRAFSFYIADKVNMFWDFVEMFYTDNCPSIEIVQDDNSESDEDDEELDEDEEENQ